MPGSTQLRLSATSISLPSNRSSASHSTRLRPRRLGEVAQQRAPGAEQHAAAALDRRGSPRRGAGGWPGRAGSPGLRAGFRSNAASRPIAAASRSSPSARRIARVDQPVDRRPRLGFEAIAAVGAGRARQHLPPHQRQKLSNPGRPRPSAMRWCQPSAGRMRGATSASTSSLCRSSSASTQVADAALQAAGARARRLGAEEPAPQLAPLLAREPHRKRRVGGFEQMMALVEDIAGRHRAIVEPAERRLRHHQRVVGDHERGMARGAHILLDKAFAEMRAGRMDAFAAPVGERR